MSAVISVFGMFLVLSTAVGILVLGESVTVRKLGGVVFVVVSVWLAAAP